MKHFKPAITTVHIISILCIVAVASPAQTDSSHHPVYLNDTATPVVPDTIIRPVPGKQIEQKDIIDVFKKLFNIKSKNSDSIENKKKVTIAVMPAAGYSLQSKLAVLLTGNATIRNSKDTTTRLSLVTSSVVITQNKQILFPVQSLFWTRGNKYALVGDWRIMRYPQDTYGLGGYSSLDSANHMDYYYLRLRQHILKEMSDNFYVGVGYNFDYHWNIIEEGNPGGSKSDYEKYGASSKTISSGPSVSLLYDSRESIINPQQGFFGNVIYRRNYTFLGSDENWGSLIVDVRKYFPFPARTKNILAFWSYNWLTTDGNPPYLDLPSTAWDPNTNTGRGYIQARFRSKNMLYLETEYRFRLTPDGLLGAVVFGNLQAFSEWPSNKFETLRPAYGAGLRIKLNKKSNTNIDLDYGFGIGGSKGLTVNIAEIF